MQDPGLPAFDQWPAPQRAALALGALFAAAQRVHEIASGGASPPDHEALDQMLRTAAGNRSPEDWAAMLPTPSLLKHPIGQAVELLYGRSPARQVLLYALQLIMLAERLAQQPAIRRALSEQLDRTHESTPSQLAEVYRATISNLGHRIQVSGHPETLNQSGIAEQIRALLLAGVRFAWLWRQLGGRRRHLILSRRKIAGALSAVRDQLA